MYLRSLASGKLSWLESGLTHVHAGSTNWIQWSNEEKDMKLTWDSVRDSGRSLRETVLIVMIKIYCVHVGNSQIKHTLKEREDMQIGRLH